MAGTRREAFTNLAVVQPAYRRDSNVRWKRPKRPQRCVSGLGGPGGLGPARRWRARWWHHFPGEGAPGRNYDQSPVTGADREGLSVSPFKNAQHVGHLLGVTRSWRAPPDHDPPADVGGCQPDVKPVAHTTHPVPAADDAARRDWMNIGPPPRRHLASRSGCGGHGGCPGVRDERKFSIRPVTFLVSARAQGECRPVAY